MEPLETEEPGRSNILSCFWELASDDFIRRSHAIESIVLHLKESCKNSKTSLADSPDGSYTLKRLIRGLSSSREFARQGFSVCLCEIVRSFDDFDITNVLNMIDDGTKVTGSMKGIEEREMIFGKLFGYVAIIRSERLVNNQLLQHRVLTVLIDLYNGKGWIKEVVSECILTLLYQLGVSEFSIEIIELLKSIFENIVTPQDMSIDQLLLTYALHHLLSTKNKNSVSELVFDFLPVEDIYSVTSFTAISPLLTESGASGYPKIHSVWKYVLGGIFGLNESRELPVIRCQVLGPVQEELLSSLVTLLDTEFLTSSQEKRSLAFHLFEQLLTLSPAELIPLSLSQSCVRCLLSTRQNKKHTLYRLAGITLNNMREAVGGSSVVRLAMASVIVQYGGANFDSLTTTTTIAALLEGLSSREIITHIKFLCDVLSKEYQAKNSSSSAPPAEEEEDEQHHLTAVSTIQALSSIIKNSKLPQRGDIISIATAILLRLSCFHTGNTELPKPDTAAATTTPKKDKKKDKKKIDPASASVVTADMLEVIQMIELGAPYPKEVTALAGSKLLSALSDVGNVAISALNTPPTPPTTPTTAAAATSAAATNNSKSDAMDLSAANNEDTTKQGKPEESTTAPSMTNNKENKTTSSSVTVIDMLLEVTSTILNSKISFLKDSSTDQLQLEDDTDESTVSGEDIFKSVRHILQQLKPYHDVSSKYKLSLHFSSLLSHAFFLTLTVDSLELQTLHTLCESVYLFYPQILRDKRSAKGQSRREEEEEDEEEDSSSAQQMLLECCLEFLSIPVDSVFKGIRDSMKMLWSCLLSATTGTTATPATATNSNNTPALVAEEEVVTALALVVLGQQDEGEEEGEEEEEEEEGTEGVSPEDEVEDEVDEEVKKKLSKNKNNKKGKDKEKVAEDEDEDDVKSDEDENNEEADKDDIHISMGSAMSMLEEDDDYEDEEGAVAHFAGADDALVEMIKQRKLTRKEGLANACRCELLHRTRALDLLEILMQKVDAAGPVLALYVPFLECVKKIETSAIMKDLPEAKSFVQKLFAFLDTKFSKKKLSLSVEDQDAIDLLASLPGLLSPYLRSNNATLKALATAFFLAVTRFIIHTTTATTSSNTTTAATTTAATKEELTTSLTTTLGQLTRDYFQIKNSKISLKVIDEILLRFSDNNTIILPTVLPVLLNACQHAKTEFLVSEAYRVLMNILKHYKPLPVTMKKYLLESVNSVIKALKVEVTKESNNSTTNNSKNKRLIIVVQCIRELVVMLKAIIKHAGDEAGQRYLYTNNIISHFIEAISQHTVTPTASTQSKIIQQNIEVLKSLQNQLEGIFTSKSASITPTPTKNNDEIETKEKSQKKKKEKNKNADLQNITIDRNENNQTADIETALVENMTSISIQEKKSNKKKVAVVVDEYSADNNIPSELPKKKKKKKEKSLAENL